MGSAHPLSFEEEQAAAQRMSESAARHQRRTKASNSRVRFNLEEVLLMMGVKEEPSESFERGYNMRAISRGYWFGGGKNESS